ncbi:MAG: potassium channel family protein [Acidipropionibacterium sp.]|jgi:voltage-gated potassium channel|nr:potassium channel family protein [Acidipropionibacterium sp.]
MSLSKWERATKWPLAALSLVFIAVYAWQVVAQPIDPWNILANSAMYVLWAMFVADYVTRLLLSERKWTFVKQNVLSLVVVVLPAFGPLRILLLLPAFNSLQRTGRIALRGRIVTYVASSVVMVVVIGSLAILDVERGAPGASIDSFGDAVWWSFITLTTVGYGNYSPVTVMGRVIAVGMMLAGIGLLSVVTSYLASWMVSRVSEDKKKSEQITRAQIEGVEKRLERIEMLLQDLQR